MWKKQSCLKMPDSARKLIENVFLKFLTNFFFFFDKYGRVAAAHYGEARASRAQGR